MRSPPLLGGNRNCSVHVQEKVLPSEEDDEAPVDFDGEGEEESFFDSQMDKFANSIEP